jgi:NtrC-family two-component system sensor histidine kinase KinB
MSAVATIEDHLADEVSALARANTEAQAFVALLAHEVRTRLKVTERALASADEAGWRIASENTWTLQELVEDLLELTRAQPAARANAGEAMRWVLDELGERVEGEIVVGELPTVALPPALLRTVLRNLVVNALEAGASRVEVFSGPDGAICVRDDGPGVSPDVAAKIFGFYSGKLGGAGLALALCRETLRRHGGEIWLEPPSTFCFRIS